MTDRVVGEREGNETKAAEACREGRGANGVPSLPAAQGCGIVADGRPVLAVGDGDEHARGGDRHCNNGENFSQALPVRQAAIPPTSVAVAAPIANDTSGV